MKDVECNMEFKYSNVNNGLKLQYKTDIQQNKYCSCGLEFHIINTSGSYMEIQLPMNFQQIMLFFLLFLRARY